MANATARVAKGTVRWTDEFSKRSTETLSAETTFYANAMLGTDSTGYLCKGDDTQSWIFAGVVRGKEGNPILPAGTAGDGTIDLDYHKPRYLEVTLASVAVTDIGKTVYALYDNEVTTDFSATTYANVVGVVVDKIAANIALVELAYDGIAANVRLGAARRISATATTTLSKYDAGKKIYCANTTTVTVNLPPVADVPAGRSLTIFKDHASDANAITLDADGSENIDGSGTLATLDAAWDVVTLVSNGARWIVESRDIA